MNLPALGGSERNGLDSGVNSLIFGVNDTTQGNAMLLNAIQKGDNETMQALLNDGFVRPQRCPAGDSRQQSSGRTQRPLELAAACGNEVAVALLLEKGYIVEHLHALLSARPSEGSNTPNNKATPPPFAESSNNSGSNSGSGRRPYCGNRRLAGSSNGSHSPGSGGRSFPGGGTCSRESVDGKYDGMRMSSFALASSKTSCGPCTSPLMWGCYKGSLPIASALLRAGFDPCYADTEGNTALHLAATSCSPLGGAHLTIIGLLINENVNVFQRNMFGNTALQLTTDKRAKQLLRAVMEDPEQRSRSGLLSLSAMVSAEENLQRLQELFFRSREEEDKLDKLGFDIFVDQVGDDVLVGAAMVNTSALEPSTPSASASESEPAAASDSSALATTSVISNDGVLARRVRSRLLRTRGMNALLNKLLNNAAELEAALNGAKSSFVAPALIKMAAKALRQATYRYKFEQDIFRVLEAGTFADLNERSFAGRIKRAAGYAPLPTHVHLRASKVLAYVQARTALQAHYSPLEIATPDSVTFEQVNQLNTLLEAFQAVRIIFDPRKKRLAELLKVDAATTAQNGANNKDTRRASLAKKKRKAKNVGAKGGNKGEKGKDTDKSKKGKATTEKERTEASFAIKQEKKESDNQAVDGRAREANELAELLASPDVEDDDDVLVRQVQGWLNRLKIEVELMHCIAEENVGTHYKIGSSERVTAIDRAHRRLDALLKHCEIMIARGINREEESTQPSVDSESFSINRDVLARAQLRFKQLTRELKIAKKHLAEHLKKLSKQSASDHVVVSKPSRTQNQTKKNKM